MTWCFRLRATYKLTLNKCYHQEYQNKQTVICSFCQSTLSWNLIFYTDLDLMSPWSKLRAGAEEDLYVIPWGQFHCEEKASLNQLIDKALNLVIELSIDYSINQSISQSVLQSISHLIKPFIRWIRFNQFSQSVGLSVSQSVSRPANRLHSWSVSQSVSQSVVSPSVNQSAVSRSVNQLVVNQSVSNPNRISNYFQNL